MPGGFAISFEGNSYHFKMNNQLPVSTKSLSMFSTYTPNPKN